MRISVILDSDFSKSRTPVSESPGRSVGTALPQLRDARPLHAGVDGAGGDGLGEGGRVEAGQLVKGVPWWWQSVTMVTESMFTANQSSAFVQRSARMASPSRPWPRTRRRPRRAGGARGGVSGVAERCDRANGLVSAEAVGTRARQLTPHVSGPEARYPFCPASMRRGSLFSRGASGQVHAASCAQEG